MLFLNSILLFFDFSGGEFMLIAVVFLTFFGSKSIPGIARTLGKAMRDFKEAANTVQREIHESATVEEVKETPKTSSSSSTSSTSSFTIAPPSSTISQETDLSAPPKTDSGSAADKPVTE